MEISVENTCRNCKCPIGADEKYCDEECEEIHFRYYTLKKEYIEKCLN
jgi:predicted nucleic acid-binding Zn ribbon protein